MYKKYITLAGCAAVVVEADALGGMVDDPPRIGMAQRISRVEDEHGYVFAMTGAGSGAGLYNPLRLEHRQRLVRQANLIRRSSNGVLSMVGVMLWVGQRRHLRVALDANAMGDLVALQRDFITEIFPAPCAASLHGITR